MPLWPQIMNWPELIQIFRKVIMQQNNTAIGAEVSHYHAPKWSDSTKNHIREEFQKATPTVSK